MDPDTLANTIARLTENGHWGVIVAQELIDALADDLEADRWELLKRLKNEHHLEAAVVIGPFNSAQWKAKAKGESC